jgi:hypothetical protein
MKDEELRTRLLQLGADVPLSTLRRWASEELIPKPVQYYKPRKKRWGRPKKVKGKELQGDPGRFSYWAQESLEAAARVWAIRHLARPTEWSEDHMLLVTETSQKDVSKADIVRGQEMARRLHTLLYTDCKEAANRFRKFLWPNGFPSSEENQPKILNFGENRLYHLIPMCIHATESVRHHIALNTPLSITYEWAIREDGSSAWSRMHIERASAFRAKITLKTTHLTPCENGYPNDYGFPRVKKYMEEGFVDEFWLEGSKLGEGFEETPFYGAIPEEFYDDHEYAPYWEEDPYGWSDFVTGYYEDES